MRVGLIGLAVLWAGMPASAPADLPRYPVSGAPYTVGPVCQSQGLDGEVSLGVDPSSGRMVAAWMQDVEGLGNDTLTTQVVVTSSSPDGRRWSPSTAPPGVTLCDVPPGPNDAVFDPSVAVGPLGRWYLGRLGEVIVPGSGLPPVGGVYVTTAQGSSPWSWPTLPMLDNLQNDFDTVVADPRVPGRAYATWTNYPLPAGKPEESRIAFSRTTNGGATFDPPTALHQSPRGRLDELSRIAVLSDGSLLVVFSQIPADTLESGSGPFTLLSTRSSDGGSTWSAPVQLARGSYADVVDPRTRTVYEPKCCVFSLAAGPGGSAHVSWTTNDGAGAGTVHVATSPDGGRTWAATATLPRSGQAFEPAVAATSRTLAVMWYGFDGAQPADQARPTTLWLARSADGGRTWTIDELAGPFDISTAPPASGGAYLGDYQSLVAVPGGFEAAFTLAKPLAHDGPTDVFAAAIGDLPARRATGRPRRGRPRRP